MMDWKKFCKKLLSPPIWLMIVLTIISTFSLVMVFTNGWDNTPIAYVAYILSFYALSTVTFFCVNFFPVYYKRLKQKIYENKFGNRFMTDVAFRTHISLYLSLGINLLYVATNLFSGFLYRSLWFAILAGYYSILAITRFLLLRYVGRTGIGTDRRLEWKRYRLCGIILMTINLILSGAVFMIIHQNRGYEYRGMLIYIMAMYTFYITTCAIVNISKYRKYQSPVMSAAKVISLVAALVSMLSLETAMLSQFGNEKSPEFRRIMIASTGAGVSIIVVTMSVYIIIKSTMEIKELNNQDSKT